MEGRGRFVHVASTGKLTHYACDSRRGKPAMDEIGILPAFSSTSVHDGWPAYDYYHQCRHSLCGAHLLRELTYVEESSPHQRGQWAAPMAELLVEIKAAVGRAVAGGESQLGEAERRKFERLYEEIVRRELELNPERTRRGSVTEGGRVRAGARARRTDGGTETGGAAGAAPGGSAAVHGGLPIPFENN